MQRSYARPEALCSAAWLADNLSNSRLRVLDGSFYLPGSGLDPRTEYARRHIPGALFFDIDGICDPATELPHMLPKPESFAAMVGALGVSNDSRIVVYDQQGSFAAPRVWWMFRAFGHADVAILDGGLGRWIAEGRPADAEIVTVAPGQFIARFDPGHVRSAAEVGAAIADPCTQIVDNRPPARFAGCDPEPRPSLHRGHVPGARNLPFLQFIDIEQHGRWRPANALRAAFAAAGVDPGRPSIAYCGSGVTACATAFAAHLLGHDTVAVYDGSWAEWGNLSNSPVEASPA